MRSVIPEGRRRPFHWHREGIVAKQAMVDALGKIGVLGRSMVVPCGRRRQEKARAVGLAELVAQLIDDGCDELVIEARTPPQDGRDQAVILDVLRQRPRVGPPMAYRWEEKRDELLWIADAIGGAVHDLLTERGVDDDWFGQVAAATGLTVEYLAL